MSKIIPFSFEKLPVRVVTRDGEPWFVAADVCEALGLENTTKALLRLDSDEQTLISIQGISGGAGNPTVNLINESGLYNLTLGSRKPEAKRFKRWVTSEVLPSIRKTGAYLAPGATLDSLPPALASQIGGIIKSVVHKQLAEALQVELPRLLHGELSRQRSSVRYGQTAGQVWSSHGLPPLKNGSQFLSRCLVKLGCCSDGYAEMGGQKSMMFDPDKSATAMKTGLLEHCKKYISQRKGQGSLFAVPKAGALVRKMKRG